MIKVVGVGILSNYSIDGFVLSGTSKELGELFGGGGSTSSTAPKQSYFKAKI
jgi:hypothetical protein